MDMSNEIYNWSKSIVIAFCLIIFVYWVVQRLLNKLQAKPQEDIDKLLDEMEPTELSAKIVDKNMVVEGHRKGDHGLIRPFALRYELPKASDDRVSSTPIAENSNVKENTSQKKPDEGVIGAKGDGAIKK